MPVRDPRARSIEASSMAVSAAASVAHARRATAPPLYFMRGPSTSSVERASGTS